MESLSLKTARLNLRAYRPEDWERVHTYASVPEFSIYEVWGPNTVEDTKKFVADMMAQDRVEERFRFEFALCLVEKDLLIGSAGIRRECAQSGVANLGWAVNPAFQNQGYATEAARALIDFGFQQLGVQVIYATCDTRNNASSRVMEKVGMHRAGLLKGNSVVKGHQRDTFRYELLRP